MKMKRLIRRIWIGFAKWFNYDFAEMLPRREQSAVSLERAKVEYEEIVDQSIRDGKFANVLWGRNHMPDDLDEYIRSFNERCSRTRPESCGSIIMDRGNQCYRPSFSRSSGAVVVTPTTKDVKPTRTQVDGEWPVDESCCCVVDNGKVYTGRSLRKYLAERKRKQETDLEATSILRVDGRDFTVGQIQEIIRASMKKSADKPAKGTKKTTSRKKAAKKTSRKPVKKAT